MKLSLSLFGAALSLLFNATALADDDWLAEADRRIESHRMADLEIRVVRDGKPVPDLKVTVTMRRHEFLFGSNIFKWDRCRTPEENEAYKKRYAELLNFATLGFYWWSYEPKPGQPNHAYARQVADWCAENGIRTKGHPLAWNYYDPPWAKNFPADEVYRRQIARVTDCTQTLQKQVGVWDVVNEAATWDREKTFKNAPVLTGLMKEHGPIEMTKACFQAARQGNPKATLLINDYILDERYDRVIEALRDDQGKPLYDAIGIQSHMHGGVRANDSLWKICERFAKFGVPLHFTEMTILSCDGPFDEKNPASPTSEAGERRQRDDVVRVYTMLFSHPAVAAVTWWDFSDQGAWMNAPAGLLRADMSPKPAYEALRELIHRRWATNATVTTDQDGKATLRAFRGDYAAAIDRTDGTTAEFPFTVMQGKNRMTFEF